MSPINRKDSLTGTTSHRSSDMGGMDNEDLTKDATTKFVKLGLDDEHAEKESKREAENTTPDSTDEPIWNRKIWLACKTGGVKEVEEYLQDAERSSLLTRGRDEYGNTALIIASLSPHQNGASTTIMKLLLKAGADINATNFEGRTALMQASLWGRLRAVELLLERNIPANTELRDKKGLKAVDLASENEHRSLERYQEYCHGHIERPWRDTRNRAHIVQRLLRVREKNISQLQVRLCKAEDTIKELEAELGASLVANRKVQGELSTKQDELDQANALCAEHVEKIAVTEKRLDTANVEIGRLNRLEIKNDGDVQFHERKLKDGTFGTQVDFIQAFRIASASNFHTGQLTYCPVTIAYMKFDGRSYFAKNGSHTDTEHGLISGNTYKAKARTLFRALGSTLPDTWFQHSEPQLMALYVDRYRKIEGLTMEEFIDSDSDVSGNRESGCKNIQIFASRKVCNRCNNLMELMNATAEKHGFKFALKCVLVEKEET
ncbi:Ankyrin repeat protein [Pyrenophora teres f. maculata]|nr:Ankyrin repeat protein [Pyrenophora teres f. maculata]